MRRHLIPDCWFTPEENTNGYCGVKSGSQNVFSALSCSWFFIFSATSSPSAARCLLSGNDEVSLFALSIEMSGVGVLCLELAFI